MLITSLNNDKIKKLVKLKEKKYRDQEQLFFVEGLDLIKEAVKNNNLIELYILDGYDNVVGFDNAIYVSNIVMKKISDMDSVTPYYGVCKKLNNNLIGNKLILLDDIQDPGNLGTIIRSAVAFNFDTVVIGNDSVDLYNPKVIRSTKGMLFNINIVITNLNKFIENLSDYKIYGTSVVNGKNIRNINVPKKSAFVIGNEGHGISKEVSNKCHDFIYINMNENCESLNAGVSAAIIMYEVSNK